MRWLVGACAVVLLGGCTSAKPDRAPPPTGETSASRPAPSSTRAAKPSTQPTGPISVGPISAVPGECPYISVDDASTMEGNRIDKHYVLMAHGKPVGCRFMFWTDAYAVLEITRQTYRSADAAYNAMVRTGQRGGHYHGVHGLVPGIDAMLYQTTFYPPDGPTDWACTFAKGTVVVTVKTSQNNVEFNARNLAATIAPRF